MITKSEIARLRGLTRKRRERRESERFVVEGTKPVLELVASSIDTVRVVATQSWFDEIGAQGAGSALPAEIETHVVDDHVVERIASTTTPQGVVAEAVIPQTNWTALADVASALVLVDVNDPGNVGTLARSADAAGIGALVLLGSTADPWSPKSVRASAGSMFRVSIVESGDATHGLERLATAGLSRIGTRLVDATPCDELDLAGRVAMILGNEAHGLDAEDGPHLSGQIDAWTSIPMTGGSELLNVAMAGTILAYEIGRQRRQ